MAVRKSPCIVDGIEYKSGYAVAKTLGIRANTPRDRLRSLSCHKYIVEHRPKEDIERLSFSCNVARVQYPYIGHTAGKLEISRNEMKRRLSSLDCPHHVCAEIPKKPPRKQLWT